MFQAVQNLFRRRQGVPDARIDRLTYAVGDVHGMYNQFVGLMRAIRRDAELFRERPRVILLGDYIDRGPDSSKVLEEILYLEAQKFTGDGWCDLEILMGNHEQAMIAFLETGDGGMWLKHGGDSTLQSYGIDISIGTDTSARWELLRQKLEAALPQSHKSLISRMKLKLEAGDYFFVHAGVSPFKPLDEQAADTFLWIRNEFLNSTKACDFVVVHGHTPTLEPVNMRWRIGVDTCAYETSVLSAVRLKDETRHFMQFSGA